MKTNDRLGVLHSGNTLLPRPNKVLPSYLGNFDFSFKFSVTVRGSYQIKIYDHLYIRATPPSKQKSRDFSCSEKFYKVTRVGIPSADMCPVPQSLKSAKSNART